MLVLLAIGGMGKSAVAWKWFYDIAPQELPTLAGRVWWSFYETDARFDNFVLRTLGYITGRLVEELRTLRAPEREEELLDILDREPYLVVLDGVERLLLAYSRSDASRLADDDLDEQTAHNVAWSMGLPPSATTSFTGQSRLRITVDPRTGVFLRRLAGLRASRVLTTSRLFPRDLQTVTAEPMPGRLASYLGEAPEVDDVTVTSVDDLSNTIELYHTLVQLGRLNDAVELLSGRIFGPLARLGGFRYLAELARIVIEDPDWLQKIAGEDKLDHVAAICVMMGVGYQLAGDPIRALDSYDLFPAEQPDRNRAAAKLFHQSVALRQRGCLAAAERCARAALAQDLEEGRLSSRMMALGSVLFHRACRRRAPHGLPTTALTSTRNSSATFLCTNSAGPRCVGAMS